MLKPEPTRTTSYDWNDLRRYVEHTHKVSLEPLWDRMYADYCGEKEVRIWLHWLYETPEELAADPEKTAGIQDILKLVFDEFGADDDLVVKIDC